MLIIQLIFSKIIYNSDYGSFKKSKLFYFEKLKKFLLD